jgi:hypothetical protein
MALRDPAIPTHRERSALQLTKHGDWVMPRHLYPVGKRTIETLVGKGWIEQGIGPSGRKQLRITQAGRAALATKIP